MSRARLSGNGNLAVPSPEDNLQIDWRNVQFKGKQATSVSKYWSVAFHPKHSSVPSVTLSRHVNLVVVTAIGAALPPYVGTRFQSQACYFPTEETSRALHGPWDKIHIFWPNFQGS